MFYKLKHIRTGLYYCPSRSVQSKIAFVKQGWLDSTPQKHYIKSNLSKKGKVYQTKPSEDWYKGYNDENGNQKAQLKMCDSITNAIKIYLKEIE
jgi:hypothetical protein